MKLIRSLLLFAAVASAQTTFNYDTTKFLQIGLWTSVSGHYDPQCSGGAIKFIPVGSTLQVIQWSTNAYWYIIDGGAPVSVSGGVASAWNPQTVYTGLSDAAHTVILFSAGVSVAFVQIAGTGTVIVTGASPSLTTITNDAEYTLKAGTSNWDLIGRLDGGPSTTTSSCAAAGYMFQFQPDGAIRFQGNITDIWMPMWQDGNVKFVIFQDGVPIGTYNTSATSTWTYAHIATGLSGTHTYRIQNSINTGVFFAHAIELVGTGGFTLPPQLQTYGSYGDSIISEQGLTNSTFGYAWPVGLQLPVGLKRWGSTGAKVAALATQATVDNIVTGAQPALPLVEVEIGGNDATGATAIGDCATAATFKGDYVTLLQRVATGMKAGSTIILRGIMLNTTMVPATIATYRTAEQQVVACYNGSPTNKVLAYYLDTANWLSTTALVDFQVDGIHPNNLGSAKMAQQLMPAVQAALTRTSFAWMAQ